MRRLVCLALLTSIAGCKTTDRGFGVELTLTIDSSVAGGQIATIKHLRFNVSGDETESPTYDFSRPAFASGPERLVYRPLVSSRSISIEVDAVDDNGTVIAAGSTGAVALPPRQSARASAILSALIPTTPDLGAGADGGVVTPRVLAFRNQGTYGAAEPVGLAAADFDGDGKVDVAVASYANSLDLTILTNNGSNAFTPHTLTVGSSLSSIVARDLNADNKPDLAMSGADGIYVLINKGDGTFKPAITYSGAAFVAAGDVTNDGKQDLVGLSSTGVTVFAGNGDGTFTAGTPIPLSNYGAVAVADLNADGKLDIIAYGGQAAATAAVLLNNGTGFKPAVVYGSVSATSLAVGDVTGDNKADLVFSQNGPAGVFVLAGNGDGTFPTAAATTIGNNASGAAILLGDLNGDQKLDVVVLDLEVDVILNMGGGVFVPGVVPFIGNGCTTGVLSDLDGDGKLDVGVGAAQANTVSIMKGDGDGTFEDGYIVGGTHGLSSAVSADVNGDHKPDLVGFNTGIGVLINSDGRSFVSKAQLSANPASLLVADIDGNQHPDLVTANGLANNISVYSNAGDGSFPSAPASYSTSGTRVVAVASADFNGDGKLDVAALNQDTKNVRCFVNSGSGLTAIGAAVALGGMKPVAIAAGDVDGDKKIDLLVADSGTGTIVVLKGAGDGTFAPGNPVAVGNGLVDLKLADLNGDGYPDVVTANRADLSVLINDKSGGFKPAVSYPVPITSAALVLADFNLDGNIDVAAAGYNSSAAQRIASIVAFSGAGDGSLAKPPLVTTTEMPLTGGSITVGDFNGDGLPDVATGSVIVLNSSH